MNILLQFTLIISIFFNVSNYVLAEQEASPPHGNTSNSNRETSTKSTDNNEQSEASQQDKKKGTTSNEETKNLKPESKKSETVTDIQKNLSIEDLLLFIDLPILAALLLLWFLNQNKQKQQIEQLTKNQNKIVGNFNQFNEVNNKLNNLDRINHQIIEKIANLEVRLSELISKQQVKHSIGDRNNSDFNSYSLNSDTYNLNSIAIVDKVSQFIETYNQDRNSVSDKAKFMVAETQASLNQRRSGSSDIVTLENTSQKKYWIIEEDNDYYLVPHAKIKIDEYNRTTLESLFNCTNFTAEYSDFKLVKPAKVSQINSETWQLEKKGKLDFY